MYGYLLWFYGHLGMHLLLSSSPSFFWWDLVWGLKQSFVVQGWAAINTLANRMPISVGFCCWMKSYNSYHFRLDQLITSTPVYSLYYVQFKPSVYTLLQGLWLLVKAGAECGLLKTTNCMIYRNSTSRQKRDKNHTSMSIAFPKLSLPLSGQAGPICSGISWVLCCAEDPLKLPSQCPGCAEMTGCCISLSKDPLFSVSALGSSELLNRAPELDSRDSLKRVLNLTLARWALAYWLLSGSIIPGVSLDVNPSYLLASNYFWGKSTEIQGFQMYINFCIFSADHLMRHGHRLGDLYHQ